MGYVLFAITIVGAVVFIAVLWQHVAAQLLAVLR